jgi:BirA family transcriptional regulator, biotin operon repressor / biotin---[acetyl-CoA-carboxylase] ligase
MATRLIGKQRIGLDEVDSTNLYAMQLVENSIPEEGTLITANLQLTGRGQRGSQWMSKKGLNLTGTYILKPGRRGIKNPFDLNKAVALAVRNTAEKMVRQRVWVKWPNDIVTEDGKLAGILIENRMTEGQWDYSLVGIGLNVNETDFNLASATSIRLMIGNPIHIEEVIAVLNAELEKLYFMLSDTGPHLIREEYQRQMLGVGEMRLFREATSHREFQAEVKGADGSGRLLLATSDGSVLTYDLKEIIWL